MSKHKAIPKKMRLSLYEKYNHKCAYCGCDLEYKDMQIDHVESVYANTDIKQTMTNKEMYSEKNLMPACRQCNFYKSSMTLEAFRQRIRTTMWNNLRKDFGYRLALKYGLITENPKDIVFYFETLVTTEN